MDDLIVNADLTIPAADLEWTAVRASGPGGQNVNKVASKIDLRFDLEGTAVLTAPQKARLRVLAGQRTDADGRLVVTSQLTRDQSRNLEDARARLVELVAAALIVPKKRRATRPTRGSVERRIGEKKHRAKTKSGRGPIDA